MESLASSDFITPAWYRLQTSANGEPYVQLPERPGREPTFLTSLKTTDDVDMATIMDLPLFHETLISIPKPYTVRDADFWITLQLSGKSGLPLQALRSGDPDTGVYIGGVTLFPAAKAPAQAILQHTTQGSMPGEYELGYCLNPSYHRKGIMRDAVLALLAWAIEEAGVRNVVVSADEINSASVKLIESLPFFSRSGEAQEKPWPEHKGGGMRTLLTWRWNRSN